MQRLITHLEQPFVLPLLKEKPDSDLAHLLRALSTTRRYITCLSDDKDEVDTAGFDLRVEMSESEVEAVLEAMGRNRRRCCSRVSKISIGKTSSEASVEAVLGRIEAGWFPSLRWLEVHGKELDTRAVGEALGRVMEKQEGLEMLVVSEDDDALVDAVAGKMARLRGLKVLRVKTESPWRYQEAGRRLISSLVQATTSLEVLELEIGTNDCESKALSGALSQFQELRELDLRLDSIGEAGVIWGQMTKLERLRLTGKIEEEEETASLYEALRGMTRLRHLDLDRCRILDETFIELMGALGGLTQLETLNIKGCSDAENGFSEEERAALVRAMRYWPQLRSLHLSDLDDETGSVLRGLVNLPRLERLDVSASLDTEGSERLAAYLENNVTLKELLLEYCDVSPEGMEAIGRQVRHLAQLETLDISENWDDGTCEALAESLGSLGKLRKLNILRLSPEGTSRIIRELWRVPSLTNLCLRCTTSDQVASLSEQLWALTGMHELSLISNEVGEPVDGAPLIEKLHFLARLETLDLYEIDVSGEGLQRLAQQLSHLDRLTKLSLHHLGLEAVGAVMIADACERLRQMRHLVLSGLDAINDATKLALVKRCLPHGPLSHLRSFNVFASSLFGVHFDIDDKGSYARRHPLHFAAGSDDVALVRELLVAGASVNETEKYRGECALHFAARAGRDEAIRVLVEEGGASLGIKSKGGETALDISRAGSTTRALLEEMVYVGADERPGEMTKSAAKRFKPLGARQ